MLSVLSSYCSVFSKPYLLSPSAFLCDLAENCLLYLFFTLDANGNFITQYIKKTSHCEPTSRFVIYMQHRFLITIHHMFSPVSYQFSSADKPHSQCGILDHLLT